MNPYLITGVVGYRLGSIPFGFLLLRIFRGEDVRTSGSGNIGATNVARRSPTLGIATLLLDAAKGLGAVRGAAATAHHDLGSVVRRAGPSFPGLAHIPRRQGRRH